jgi:hypothetical protein
MSQMIEKHDFLKNCVLVNSSDEFLDLFNDTNCIFYGPYFSDGNYQVELFQADKPNFYFTWGLTKDYLLARFYDPSKTQYSIEIKG